MTRRVALIVHPGAELFGSDRMALESAVALRESGHRVVVALASHGPLVAELRAAGAEVVITRMLVLRKALLRPSGWMTLLRDSLRGAGAAWRLLQRVRPDVVYVSTITLPFWPLMARLKGVPSVSHVHEAEASGSNLLNALLYLPHLASRRTLVNSRFSLDTIRRALPALVRTSSVLYNGVAAPTDPTPPRRWIDGPLRLTYIGRLSPRKGPDLLIDAARLLEDAGQEVHVTLLGAAFEGYEWFEAELRSRARSASVTVDFAGFHADVWPFLADADVIVVPSRGDEPFGNTAVEAVLALRPVIASDSSGLREAVAGIPTARLFEAGDAEALACAVREVVDGWAEVAELTTTAAEIAHGRYSPETYRFAIRQAVLVDD